MIRSVGFRKIHFRVSCGNRSRRWNRTGCSSDKGWTVGGFHDDTFERICGRGQSEDTSYEEMQKYRLAETKERIPLLSEVLQLVDGKVPLLIEVKLPNTDTKICRKLDEELRKYHGEYMIQSFNSLVLRWMKKHRNEIPRGQLSENLTKNDRTTHYLLRFCVKYLLSNCMCRPDFILTDGRTERIRDYG